MSESNTAIVFDLDGTLVDSLGDLTAALNRMLAELGRTSLDSAQTRAMVGDGAAKLVARALAATGELPDDPDRHLGRFLEIYENGLADQSEPFPDVAETLAELSEKGWRLAVCTNKPRHAAIGLLTSLGLIGRFDLVAGGDSFPARKPDPGPLLGILAALDVPAARAVMVGDHLHDVACARAAGVPVVAVAYGYFDGPTDALGADLVVERFAAVPDAARRLLASGTSR